MPGSILNYRLRRPAYLILLGLAFASSYLDETIDAQVNAVSEAAITQMYTGLSDQQTWENLDRAGKRVSNLAEGDDPDAAFEDVQRAAREYAEQAERNSQALEAGSLGTAYEVIGKPLIDHARRQPMPVAFSGAVILLGILTLPFVAWMVFARVRDIGWPVYLSVATLSPLFALRLFGADMTDESYYSIQYAFFASLVALGLVPPNLGAPRKPEDPDEPESVIRTSAPAVGTAPKSRPKTFGRRS